MKTFTPSASVLRQARERAGLSQRDVAALAGTAQSVIARIERGQTSPSIETLSRLLDACGFEYQLALTPRAAADPVISAYKRDIDRSLLRENVKLSFDDRVRTLASLASFAAEARKAGKRAGH